MKLDKLCIKCIMTISPGAETLQDTGGRSYQIDNWEMDHPRCAVRIVNIIN
jgi:hypothetical protein